MNSKYKALKAAFLHSIPVMTGYLFMGAAFGILLQSKGYHAGWAVLMAVVIYAGSMQFMGITLLAGQAGLAEAFSITLLVNARHLFYGLSLLTAFDGMKRKKPYMMFSLTDETYSLLCAAKAPPDVDKDLMLFFVSLLDQFYWVIGCGAGALLGSVVALNVQGIDFVMTALFVVILVEQWLSSPNHLPAITGLVCSLASLLIFGPKLFLLPAMGLIMVMLLAQKRLAPKEEFQL